MLLNHERLDLLIAHYVSGCLPEPAHVLVGSHLAMQPSASRLATSFDDLAGDELHAVPPSPIVSSDERLNAIFRSRPVIEAPRLADEGEDGQFPHFLESYAGRSLRDVPWKTKLPGLKQHVIERTSSIETSLLWARPGRALPHHRHKGLELTLVLHGEFHDHRGAFFEGDVSVADEAVIHRPVAGDNGPCLCFSVLMAPIALSGPAFRIFADILGV
jgi:putative transcriptional regulator